MEGLELAGRRVLVTGHTGFKGSWLVHWLHELGATVSGYALEPPTTPSHFEAARTAELLENDIRADVRDAERLKAAVEECAPDVVFHLAAQSLVRAGYREPAETFDVNAQGTVHLLDAVRGRPCAVIAITTDKCYENDGRAEGYVETDRLGGRDPYSASKACAELAVGAYRQSYGIRLASARAGNVIGGGDWAEDRLVPDTIRALESGEPVRVRNPDAVRPWQHVLEPLSGYLLLASRMLAGDDVGGAWNFANDDAVDVRTMVERLLELWGGGHWEDASEPGAPHEAAFLRLDARKAREELGWRPKWSVDEALKRVVEWHRAPADVTREQIREYAGD